MRFDVPFPFRFLTATLLLLLPFQSGVRAAEPQASAPPSDEFIGAVCLEAETANAKAAGHVERAADMANLLCQMGLKTWQERGCGDDPSQDGCKKMLEGFDDGLKLTGSSMLYAAAHAGRTEICKAMVALGRKPDAPANEGWTPVMIAAAENKPETVSYLLSAGANPNAASNLGRTPVMFAANYGYTDIVEMLAKAGADLNAVPTDDRRMPALSAAAANGHAATAAALLRLGAKPDAVDGEGATALLRASGAHHGPEIVRALLDGGADVNAGSPGPAALAVAVAEQDTEIVTLLLERGADANASFPLGGLEGVTPLMVAAHNGHLEVVKLLAAHGADPSARNAAGSTARDLALMAGHQEVVDALALAGGKE